MKCDESFVGLQRLLGEVTGPVAVTVGEFDSLALDTR
jgi:hypothetical protein